MGDIIPRAGVWIRITGIGFVSLGLMGLGDGVAQKNQRANELFAQGSYDEALKLYRDAQVERPDLPVLHFNVGNTLYKKDGLDRALSEYQSALRGDEPPVNARAYYNIGNTFFKQGKLEEAIEAYRKSLEIDPTDVEAKFNLEFAQLRLQQQQQNEQKNEQQEGEQEGEEQEGEEQEGKKEQGEEEQQGESEQEEQEDRAQAEPQENPEGQMSEEEAQRILNALNEKEKEVQERRRAKVARRVIRELDW